MSVLTSASQIALSEEELTSLCRILGVQVLPTVLAVDLDAVDADESDAPVRAALAERGILDSDDDLDYGLAEQLRALATPDWTIECRRVDAKQMLRICLVARGDLRLLVVRDDDGFTLTPQTLPRDGELIVAALTPYVGVGQSASVAEFRCLSDDLDRHMSTARSAQEYAGVFAALGADVKQAGQLGTLLTSCAGQTEIVAYHPALTVPRVTAIIDTPYGRIVSTALAEFGDPRRWTTIAPGSRERVRDALARLLHDLPEGG
ncbi:ESX secretion-associated protein EspG [Gordonia sp. X0973]|uniref:ESX secretion-associated protein EspG n=1 Tax=Gordonia sp. X0973 TaxID=2742602 RepID=UPI000F52A42A|nr:ESX secretion-associated protein EspG [Gordonia sp. X0973]QKT06985.1 ESX secretion-associated protein EspG [Gordonia sp. X0973]